MSKHRKSQYNAAKRILELAESANISDYMLGQICHIAYSTVASWRNQEHAEISFFTIELVCQGLHITFEEFFSDQKPEEIVLKEGRLQEIWDALTPNQRSSFLDFGEYMRFKNSPTVIGQAIFADHRIELTAVSDQTAMVFLHEIGHIVEKKIRPELIRNGYTSRETLPDIVFHGGADTAYHEQLYGEYLANYLGESIYYRENAELAGKRFLSMYLQCIRAL